MIVLVLGGTRSGKSEVAERITDRLAPPVTYVATTILGEDADLSARVAAHRSRRPPLWKTVETEDDLVDVLARLDGTVLVDSLGSWVARGADFVVDAVGLCRALSARSGDSVIVSDEVGLGVHPSTEVGRRFRDSLGELNRAVADVADEVLLVVAGRVLPLDAVGERHDGAPENDG